jgi:polyisoprenoid-binding protein YceI
MIKVNGNLTLHGTTRGIEVYSQATVQDDSLQAAGQFALNQTDFGIKLVSVAVGMLKVKDQVKASFEIVARKTA